MKYILTTIITLACLTTHSFGSEKPWINAGFNLSTVCEVHYITDGDTFKCVDGNKKEYRVRIAGIDTPEMKQDFGRRAKDVLVKTLLGKKVVIDAKKNDRYGRIVSTVSTYGKNSYDVGAFMVGEGFAWDYPRYKPNYSGLQDLARSKRNGLWRKGNAIAPWDFRKNKRNKASTVNASTLSNNINTLELADLERIFKQNRK